MLLASSRAYVSSVAIPLVFDPCYPERSRLARLLHGQILGETAFQLCRRKACPWRRKRPTSRRAVESSPQSAWEEPACAKHVGGVAPLSDRIGHGNKHVSKIAARAGSGW